VYYMQDVDAHHSRSSTHSPAHAPSEAAAAEAGTITDAAQLPDKLPVDPGTSTNPLLNRKLPAEQLLEQLPVMHEKADPAISRILLPLDSRDDDVAHMNSQHPDTPAKPENDWVSLC